MIWSKPDSWFHFACCFWYVVLTVMSSLTATVCVVDLHWFRKITNSVTLQKWFRLSKNHGGGIPKEGMSSIGRVLLTSTDGVYTLVDKNSPEIQICRLWTRTAWAHKTSRNERCAFLSFDQSIPLSKTMFAAASTEHRDFERKNVTAICKATVIKSSSLLLLFVYSPEIVLC